MSTPPELREVQRIIPVMESKALNRGVVSCVSLELYDDGAYVNFWAYPPEGSAPNWMPALGVVATDNLGTSYRAWIGGGAGADSRFRIAYMIEPEMPGDAEWLELAVRVGEWRENPPEARPTGSTGQFAFDENDEPGIFRIPLGTG